MAKARVKVAKQLALRVVDHAVADVGMDEMSPRRPQRLCRGFAQHRQMAQVNCQPKVGSINAIGKRRRLDRWPNQALLLHIAIKVLQRDVQPGTGRLGVSIVTQRLHIGPKALQRSRTLSHRHIARRHNHRHGRIKLNRLVEQATQPGHRKGAFVRISAANAKVFQQDRQHRQIHYGQLAGRQQIARLLAHRRVFGRRNLHRPKRHIIDDLLQRFNHWPFARPTRQKGQRMHQTKLTF